MFPEFHLLHRAAQRADQVFSGHHSEVTPRQFLILVALNTARAYAVTLAPAGRQVLADASKAAAATDQELFSGLTASQRSQLLAMLDAIVRADMARDK